MSLQGKSQMKITLSWIIVNLTEFLLIPWVSLQPGLSFGLSAWVFLGFILNFAYLIMWPPRPLCPPPLELFQKFSRFGDATCPFLTDLVPGDFHWYHISLLFFFWGTLWMPSGNLFWSISNIFIHYFLVMAPRAMFVEPDPNVIGNHQRGLGIFDKNQVFHQLSNFNLKFISELKDARMELMGYLWALKIYPSGTVCYVFMKK